jgi:hypothetical protein
MCPKRLCRGALSPSPCTSVRVVSIASLTGASVWAISSDGTESSLCVAVAWRGLNGQQPHLVLGCTLTKPLARLFWKGHCVPACSALRL